MARKTKEEIEAMLLVCVSNAQKRRILAQLKAIEESSNDEDQSGQICDLGLGE